MVIEEILETVFCKHHTFNGHLFDGSYPLLCFESNCEYSGAKQKTHH